jgi:hypothetical protein
MVGVMVMIVPHVVSLPSAGHCAPAENTAAKSDERTTAPITTRVLNFITRLFLAFMNDEQSSALLGRDFACLG